MTYNLSAINASGMVGLTQGVNNVLMFNQLGILILISFALLLFTSYIVYTRDMRMSIGTTSLICAIMVIFLRNFSLVSDTAVFTTWVIAAIAGAYSILSPE